MRAPLALAILALAAYPSAVAATAPVDGCSLLARAEAERALGGPLRTFRPPNTGGEDCAHLAFGPDGGAERLVSWKVKRPTASAGPGSARGLVDSLRPAYGGRPVAGVGDEAFWAVSADGDIMVFRKGGAVVQLTVKTRSGSTLEAARRLALLIAARLP